MYRVIASMVAAVLMMASAISTSQAVDVNAQRDVVNGGVVGVLGGSASGTAAQLAWDLSVALDDGYDLRVLPMMGKGSVRSIEDLLLLRGVDIAIVQSDVLDFYKRTNIYENIENRIGYITQLYNEEIHLLARKEITSVDQLNDKEVNFGPDSSGSFMTASIIFDQLGVKPKITSLSYEEGMAKLRSGEISGWLRVAGAPMSQVSELKETDGVHLLAIPKYKITGAYNESTFTNDLYPALVAPGETVATVAVGAVMAAYNWPSSSPRFTKVQRFIQAFDQNLARLKDPETFHPKWSEVSLDRTVDGWKRIERASASATVTQ